LRLDSISWYNVDTLNFFDVEWRILLGVQLVRKYRELRNDFYHFSSFSLNFSSEVKDPEKPKQQKI
jgi:hypothetical protein